MTDELEQMSPNQRRALDKALSALETFAAIWAAEIRLGAMSARIAAVPSEAERAKRIAAMIEQGFIEGAYRHYLDHKDKCDEVQAARATAEQPISKRLINAIEGECEGLAITDVQATNILANLQYGAPMDDVLKDAERYQKLRNADIESVSKGGVFAGLTPNNVVINGEDLDIAVDLLIDGKRET